MALEVGGEAQRLLFWGLGSSFERQADWGLGLLACWLGLWPQVVGCCKELKFCCSADALPVFVSGALKTVCGKK